MVGAPSLAWAEPSDQEKALATTLFNEAKSLLADGKVAEACRNLEESRRLDPRPGTILNLAACHESEGLMASAASEFREARLLAERDGRRDRVAFADQHLAAIEPKISQLVIVVGPDADLAELRITRDATPLSRAAWGTRIPIDPGEHVVEASAPRKKTWRTVVTVGRDGDVQTAVVAALADDLPAAPPPAVVVPDPHAEAPRDVPAPESAALSTRRKIGLTAAGVGVLALGAGSYFGVRAALKHGDRAATCRSTPCSAESISLNDQAKFAADVATVSFVVALVALGGAAFLWFGDAPARSTAPVRLSPSFGPGQSRIELSGHF